MREAYVDDKDTYEGGETDDEEEDEEIEELDGDALLCKLVFALLDVAALFELAFVTSPHVFMITSSRVCTKSSVFALKYGFDEADDELEEFAGVFEPGDDGCRLEAAFRDDEDVEEHEDGDGDDDVTLFPPFTAIDSCMGIRLL